MKLSDNLKTIRKENNLSQEQFAEQLGVSRQAVSKWESDQSYPEMDKVLLICKLYGYGIDELMNENVSTVKEERQYKNNINKYIDDFFAFITKTVDMLSSMTFKQKVKCLFEQMMISTFLLFVFVSIALIGSSICAGLLGKLPILIYYTIRDILSSIYIMLAVVVGITILLHIFKVRYLDYYEIVKEEPEKQKEYSYREEKTNEHQEQKIMENNKQEEKKIFIKKEKEKIIIRDPEHSQSKFLTGIIKIILIILKIIAVFLSIPTIITFIILITLIVISFLFIKTGLLFFGSLVRTNRSNTNKLHYFTNNI